MRSVVYVLSLALAMMAQAAPLPEPESSAQVASRGLTFTHDPYSIHRRSPAPLFKRSDLHEEDDADAALLAELESADELAGEVSLEACSTECGVIKIEGVKSEKEALCSDTGLEATQNCAKCIDTTWPNTRFQESAMAEYNKLVALCEAGTV